MFLVVLDAFFVLAELLIDLSVIKLDHDHIVPEVRTDTDLPPHSLSSFIPTHQCVSGAFLQIFHYFSLALLTFFMVELVGKLYAYRWEYFQHNFEVFDGLIVVFSFVLDIVFIFHEDAFDGIGLLILLRLWRVARIINGEETVLLEDMKSQRNQTMLLFLLVHENSAFLPRYELARTSVCPASIV